MPPAITTEQLESPVRPSEHPPRILPSTDLLQGDREVWIEHGQQLYRLRLTSSNKLYLTK